MKCLFIPRKLINMNKIAFYQCFPVLEAKRRLYCDINIAHCLPSHDYVTSPAVTNFFPRGSSKTCLLTMTG